MGPRQQAGYRRRARQEDRVDVHAGDVLARLLGRRHDRSVHGNVRHRDAQGLERRFEITARLFRPGSDHSDRSRVAVGQAFSEALGKRANGAVRPDEVNAAKLREGAYDAIVLAAAGLIRLERQNASDLGLDSLVNLRLDPAVFVPAPAQGALALQCRGGDRVVDAVAPLHDADAAVPVRAERELLRLVDGGCDLPFGAWCRRLEGGDLELVSVIESDGLLVRQSGRGENPEELAARLWARLSDKLCTAPADGAGVEA